MSDRNWSLVLGVISTFVIFGVALFSGVSEETAVIRGLVGGLVGGFIGIGLNYLGAAAVPARGTKGNSFDVVLPEASGGVEPLDLTPRPERFVPMDFAQAARVVQQTMHED
ncbi:MAG TPA: hypothetical protein V6D00_11070 [Pantanalinema sp.]